jgi:UDP-N-acetylmuramyl tripeptide synthase
MRFALANVTSALEAVGLLVAVRGALPEFVDSIADDSREVAPNSLFMAVKGAVRDGHDYLDRAESQGASAALVEDPSRTSLPVIAVREGRKSAAIAAATAFGNPSRKLRMIGITGTNGKSTTAGILRHLLDDAGARSASGPKVK